MILQKEKPLTSAIRIDSSNLPYRTPADTRFFYFFFLSFFIFFLERLILEMRLNVLIFLLRFEAENVLQMFLNYMVYTTCILVNQCRRDQKTYQSALPAELWYQEPLIMTN